MNKELLIHTAATLASGLNHTAKDAVDKAEAIIAEVEARFKRKETPREPAERWTEPLQTAEAHPTPNAPIGHGNDVDPLAHPTNPTREEGKPTGLPRNTKFAQQPVYPGPGEVPDLEKPAAEAKPQEGQK